MRKRILLLAVIFSAVFATAAHATPVLFNVIFNSVSEPVTMMLLGSGLFGLGTISRRKLKK